MDFYEFIGLIVVLATGRQLLPAFIKRDPMSWKICPRAMKKPVPVLPFIRPHMCVWEWMRFCVVVVVHSPEG